MAKTDVGRPREFIISDHPRVSSRENVIYNSLYTPTSRSRHIGKKQVKGGTNGRAVLEAAGRIQPAINQPILTVKRHKGLKYRTAKLMNMLSAIFYFLKTTLVIQTCKNKSICTHEIATTFPK